MTDIGKAAVEVKGVRLRTRGKFDTGIRLEDCENVTVRDCVVIGDTYPRRTRDWLFQHPSLRRRPRARAFARRIRVRLP